MRDFQFVQVDVFTEQIFGGNPLAVVFDAADLSAAEMQLIARETNLSETTFVSPPTRSQCLARVRIFTPGRELPFAGHPTIGTAWVLAAHGRIPGGRAFFSLQEEIGPVPVLLEGDPARPSFVWMKHREARFGSEVKDRAGVARALGLKESDLLAGAPIQPGSTGAIFLYVPLRQREAVDRAVLNVSKLVDLLGDKAHSVFVFAPHPDPATGQVYARMFAPHTARIPEDPATGSASGALGAYLVRHGLVRGADEVRIVSEQGTKMGRQSFVYIQLRVHKGRVDDIRVGGRVVPVLEGRLRIP